MPSNLGVLAIPGAPVGACSVDPMVPRGAQGQALMEMCLSHAMGSGK